MRIPFWYLVLAIRIHATMCVVGLINGELAAACYTCASRAGWTGVPLEKCHMFGTSYLQPNESVCVVDGRPRLNGGEPFTRQRPK